MGVDQSSVGPDDASHVQYAIQSLDHAYDHLTAVTELNPGLIDAWKAIIKDCLNLWEKWAQILVDLHNHAGDDQLWQDNIRKLEAGIAQIAESNSTGDIHSLEWFQLGKEITDGYWHFPKFSLRAAGFNNRGPIPPAQTPDDPWWGWSYPDEVQRLFARVDISQDELFPEIENNAENAGLLPYNPTDNWPWFRIEAGLKKLLPAKPRINAKPTGIRLTVDLDKLAGMSRQHELSVT